MAKRTATLITIVLVMLLGTSLHAEKGGNSNKGGGKDGSGSTPDGFVLLRDWTDHIKSDGNGTYFVVEISSGKKGGKFRAGPTDETNLGRTQSYDFVGECLPLPGSNCDSRFDDKTIDVKFGFEVRVSDAGGMHGMGIGPEFEVFGTYTHVFTDKLFGLELFGENTNNLWFLSFDPLAPNCGGSTPVTVKRLDSTEGEGVWEVKSGGFGCLHGGKRIKGQEEFAGIYAMDFAMLIYEGDPPN